MAVMSRQPACFIALLAAVLAAGGSRSHAQTTVGQALDDFSSGVDGYNLMTLGGGATLSSYTSTAGSLAIDGNLDLGAGKVANVAADIGPATDPALYVTGSLTLTGTAKLENGYASLPGETSADYSWNATKRYLTSAIGGGTLESLPTTGSYASTSPLGNPGPVGFNFAAAISQLSSASATLAGATADGTISVSSKALTFTPNATPAAGSTVVFQLDASQISGSTYEGQSFTKVTINVPTDVNYVINVINATSGTTLFGSGVTMKSGTNDDQLLWNIEGAATVTLGGGNFYGAILAPSATIDNGGATVTGQVAAESFDDSGNALDFAAFDSAAVVAPEPATFALWGAAICGLAIAARRLRRRRPAAYARWTRIAPAALKDLAR